MEWLRCLLEMKEEDIMHTHLFTIFTPTLNRGNLLPRLYNSIKRQTFKDFVWVVMYGESVDNTEEVLERFREENEIDIQIVRHPNCPPLKHLALKWGFENCKTPYFVDIDDDDELVSEALAIFYRAFVQLEKEGRDDIASVRALAITDTGDIVIKDKRKVYTKPFDERFLNVDYNYTSIENLTCFNVIKAREARMFDGMDLYLHYDISHIGENIFWGRLSRLYSTRYIPEVLRIMHLTPVSLTRTIRDYKFWLTSFVNLQLTFEEHNDFFKKKPMRYLKAIVRLSLLACTLRDVRYKDLLVRVSHGRTLLVLLFPFAYVTALVVKLFFERRRRKC